MKRRMDRSNCDDGNSHDDINGNTGMGLFLRGVRGLKQLAKARFKGEHARVRGNRHRYTNDVTNS